MNIECKDPWFHTREEKILSLRSTLDYASENGYPVAKAIENMIERYESMSDSEFEQEKLEWFDERFLAFKQKYGIHNATQAKNRIMILKKKVLKMYPDYDSENFPAGLPYDEISHELVELVNEIINIESWLKYEFLK